MPILDCAYCEGTGRDPIKAGTPCTICGGKGKHKFSSEAVDCAYCGGTGRDPIKAGTPCKVCNGKGNVEL